MLLPFGNSEIFHFCFQKSFDNLNLFSFLSVSQLKGFTLFISQNSNYMKGMKIKIHLEMMAAGEAGSQNYPILQALRHSFNEPYQ